MKITELDRFRRYIFERLNKSKDEEEEKYLKSLIWEIDAFISYDIDKALDKPVKFEVIIPPKELRD